MRIRAATPDDARWILPLAPRLHAFGPPPWRARDVMDDAVTRGLARALATPAPDEIVHVATADDAIPVGFCYVHSATDFFTGERHGHISDLVVAPEAEGQGVGRALLDAAESWARARAYRLLTLNVFQENLRARRLYERSGYEAELTRFAKVL